MNQKENTNNNKETSGKRKERERGKMHLIGINDRCPRYVQRNKRAETLLRILYIDFASDPDGRQGRRWSITKNTSFLVHDTRCLHLDTARD